MRLPTNNKEWLELERQLQLVFLLDAETMSEKLLRGNKIIYDEPLGTWLSNFLNNFTAQFAKKHSPAIKKNLLEMLLSYGINIAPDAFDSSGGMEIMARLLGFDSWDELIKVVMSNDCPKNIKENYDNAQWFNFGLNRCLEIFDVTIYDAPTEKDNSDILKDLMRAYAEKLNTDPICKELAFFYSVFNNNAYYTFYNRQFNVEEFSHKNSCITADMLLNDMRSAYIFRAKNESHRTRYNVESYEDICVATLEFIIKHNIGINKCQNCAKYFIPQNRSDEMYCDNSSPQDSSKTCKQYGSARLWYAKMMDDAVLKQCKNLYNEKQMRARRNPDVKAYAVNFDEFKCQSLGWKKRYKAGECTADEFIAWLDEQKARKT